MGFLGTIKNKLGIGGVKVTLQIPGHASKNVGVIEGKMVLTTKSEQEVVDHTVTVIEEYTTGKGDSKKTKTFELGKIKIAGGYSIAPGDTKEIGFSLPFAMLKSENDIMKEKGGVLGALGKAGSFLDGERSEYFVKAVVDVKSAALDPLDKSPIKLVQ